MSTTTGKKIGLATATTIGMNAMIGAGIFTVPTTMTKYVGPAGILAYLFVITSVWFMALSLARLAAMYPQEGSFYTYARQWGGHITGVMANSAYLIGLTIAMGLLARTAGHYLAILLHDVGILEFGTQTSYSLGIGILVILTVLNMFGAALSELGQQVLIVCTVFPLIATTIMCFFKAKIGNLTPFAPYGFRNVFAATREAIFGFFGFECAASLFNIVENPKQNVPRALSYSITIVGSIYLLFVASLIVAVPTSLLSTPGITIPHILKMLYPESNLAIFAIHISVLSAVLGTIHSMIWSASALLSSFLHILGCNVQRIPNWVFVLAISSAIGTSFMSISNEALFMSLTAACIVFAYTLSIITLFTKKEEWKSGRNIGALIGIGTASAIFYFALERIFQALQ